MNDSYITTWYRIRAIYHEEKTIYLLHFIALQNGPEARMAKVASVREGKRGHLHIYILDDASNTLETHTHTQYEREILSILCNCNWIVILSSPSHIYYPLHTSFTQSPNQTVEKLLHERKGRINSKYVSVELCEYFFSVRS